MWKWEAEGQPRAVIAIIHSAYEHHRWYAWLIEKLRMNGFHIVMGDLPGHGEQYKFTRAHNEDFEEYRLHTVQVLKVAAEYNLPIFIIGNGLGGLITLTSLPKIKTEIAGTLLISPWIHLKKTPGKLSNALTSLGKLTSNVKLTHDVTFNDFSRNSEVYSEMKSDDLPFNNVITVKWYQELQTQMKLVRNPELKLKDIPMLVMTGGQDSISDIAASKNWLIHHAKYLSHFQYREWKSSYHSLYFEVEREDIFRYTLDFINNCLRSVGYIIE